MAEVGIRWKTFIGDFAILGAVGAVVILIEKSASPHRRGFFCEDESIRYPTVPHTKFNSKSLAALCLIIAFTTVTNRGLVLLILLVAVPPTRRGFFCEDESIRYPFHPSTVPNYYLYIFGVISPLVVIVITEYVTNRRVRQSGQLLCRPVPVWMIYTYRSLVDVAFGVVASQLVTDAGKYTIGRLRPNFLAVCRPDIKLDNCSLYNHRYIEDYRCNAEDDARESRVSFPSGHSSFSAYMMLYLAIYIQVKVVVGKRTYARLCKHLLQLAFVLVAYYTALSRVMDNKHHWSDVLAGALIGSITASLVARYVSGLLVGTAEFKRERSFHDLSANSRSHPLNSRDVESGGTTKDLSVIVDTRTE